MGFGLLSRFVRGCVGALLLLVVAGSVGSGSAVAAGFGVGGFDVDVSDGLGGAFTQAGGHPFAAATVLHLDTDAGTGVPVGGLVKDVVVDLPPGFAGNPTAVPVCSAVVFINGDSPEPGCPLESQVGIVHAEFGGSAIDTIYPVFNIQPPPGVAAEFAIKVAALYTFVQASIRPDDFGVRVRARNIEHALGFMISGSRFTFWGTPADPGHDTQRCYGIINTAGPDSQCASGSPSGAQPAKAFLTNPTSCPPAGHGIDTKVSVTSYTGDTDSATVESHDPPGYTFENRLPKDQWGPAHGPTGCEAVPFDPTFSATPESSRPDSPTGLTVDLSFPQDGLVDPAGTATSHLKRATVTLPEGMTISPSAAHGLKACSDSEIAFKTDDPVRCPLQSKVGDVSATTPLLAEPLTGAVYIGSQRSSDPESGEMFRIFLVLENKDRGVLIKLPGQVRANKTTGRIETTFDNQPQAPITHVSLQLTPGARGPLATPSSCGEKTIDADLESWSGKTVHRTSTFTIACEPGMGGFAPAFSAGTTNNLGGVFSPLAVQIDRPDRDQFLANVSVEMPDGLLGKLKGIPLCPDTQADAGTCPAQSAIGAVTVAAGPGPNPFYLPGTIALTGPYKGAPYGLSVAVPAVAGPFDLGTVVVRQAINVNPSDGHLTINSDRLPDIIKGVPARLRTAHVDANRKAFTLNPTDCDTKTIAATLGSTTGTTTTRTAPFKARDCKRLPFKPRFALTLTGKHQTTDGKHPGLKATLTQPAGQANIAGVQVKLPLSLALDPNNAASDTLCPFEEGQKPDPHCPSSSIIGRATATTPLLNQPLTGNVYFTKNIRIDKNTGRQIRTLPTLLITLRGEVSLNIHANSSISRGRLVNTITTTPDAPVTRFTLTLKGGPKGILVVTNNKNTCRGAQQATTLLHAKNNKNHNNTTTIKTPCKKQKH